MVRDRRCRGTTKSNQNDWVEQRQWYCRSMAPRLDAWRLELIRDMIQDPHPYTNAQVAEAAHCTARSVSTLRSNLRCFGRARAPANGIGRRRTVTPPMIEALCERLVKKPDLFRVPWYFRDRQLFLIGSNVSI
ncbi:hypothetical protein N7468_009894 [Penicillium chermesinum]|uniref:Uncharacterized protein n=1 Tax=Penicillium chermesinum TaxID=63820 RepID=A0A9W9NBN8_9EURO|nr:uncharacterized protein N7468_009894 [Penicillium chermesinum]KAJ5216886.1 hypothetical protein N7468_009894 [Penicillium chermesinum]